MGEFLWCHIGHFAGEGMVNGQAPAPAQKSEVSEAAPRQEQQKESSDKGKIQFGMGADICTKFFSSVHAKTTDKKCDNGS